MMRAIIIEDEIAAQNLLKSIIREYCNNIDIVGVAANIHDSVNLINKSQPDLIFMDIELLDGNSFEILDQIEYQNFPIIFTTAYEDFALKAFKYEAIGYLLKPFAPIDVQKAVAKVANFARNDNSVLSKLASMLKKNITTQNKLTVHAFDGIFILNIDEIIRIEADGPYCTIISKNEKNTLVSKPLKSLEEEMAHPSFFRVHVSHLVNINFVKQLNKEDGGTIVLTNGDKIPLSRRKKQEFLDRISKL